jgi:Collagen triple helix repeat (20 copies)
MRNGNKAKARMVGYVTQADAPLPIGPADPLVWLVARRAVDEDGDALQQGIFSNYNDDIVLEADSMTLVGRYSPARGPAERLQIGDGLRVEDGVLIGEGGGEKGDPGPMGPQGPVGPEGPAGASSSMFFYRFDSVTAANDPGAGRYRYNTSTQSAATKIYIDRLTDDGLDPTTMFKIAQFDDEFVIQKKGLAAQYQVWKLTGPAVDHADWFEIPVAFVSGTTVFSNNTNVTFLMRTRGQKGDTGAQGPIGPQGVQGIQGVQGPQGPVGGQGPVGQKGTTGDTGPQGIKGDKGDKGDTGNTGPQGIQGVKGDTGAQGPSGDFGDNEAPTDGKYYARKDAQWAEFEAGANVVISDDPPPDPKPGDLWWDSSVGTMFIYFSDGTSNQWVISHPARGEKGDQGSQGIPGNTVLYGSGIPSNTFGNNGDFYISTSSNFIYGPKASGAWPAGISLVGPQGVQGIQGPQGIQGTAGLVTVYSSDTAPPSPVDNALWWNSAKAVMYVRYRDADSVAWVSTSQTQAGPPGPAGPAAQWVQMTQAAYNAITPNPATLYVIIG